MATSTRATRFLERAGVVFITHEYDYVSVGGEIGLQAARGLGVEPSRVLKTLVCLADREPLVALVPSADRLDLKRLASAISVKRCDMADSATAERLTGYVVGGISPFAMKRKLPIYLEQQALTHSRVIVNGGRRGLQVELAPQTLIDLISALAIPIARHS